MGRRIEAIKKTEKMTIQEVMASILWHSVVNDKEHFLKLKYYEYTAYFEYDTEGDGFQLDVYYLGQDHSFMLVQPDYNSVLAAAPSILQWLEATYASSCPPEPVRPRRGRNGRVANRQQVAIKNTNFPNVLQTPIRQRMGNDKQRGNSQISKVMNTPKNA